MARARNIKPGIMENEALADLQFSARLLFIYLWMLADREGRLEDRPRRIKAQAFPYDELDVDRLLGALHDAGFIKRYTAGQVKAIQVLNFAKHQTPHIREQASSIPECDDSQPRQCLGDDMAQPRSPDSLIADSLIADSLIGGDAASGDASPKTGDAHRKTSGTPKRAAQMPDDFEPDETAAALAAELGVSLSAELPKFRDYHAARGKPMKDWQAALRTWLRNAKAFAKPAQPQSKADRDREWLDRVTGRNVIDVQQTLIGGES